MGKLGQGRRTEKIFEIINLGENIWGNTKENLKICGIVMLLVFLVRNFNRYML